MTSIAKHLPALIALAVACAFLGALAAIGSIPGHTALLVFVGIFGAVATAIGVKYGATAATPTVPVVTPPTPPVAAPVMAAPVAQAPVPQVVVAPQAA